jgi:hypothetical protein
LNAYLIHRCARLPVVLVENRCGHGIRWPIIPTGIVGISIKADRDYRPCAPIRTAPPFAAAHEFHAYRKFFMFHKDNAMGKQSKTPPMHRPRTPKERRALWRKVQAVWQQPDAISELEKIRNDWDRELPELKRMQ